MFMPATAAVKQTLTGNITVAAGSATIVGSFTAADLVGPLAGQSFSALLDALSANQIYVNVHTKVTIPK